MSDIETTLAERGKTHGDYTDHAGITQRLKDVIRSGRNYDQTTPHERETLDMIAHKIGRVVSGNPHFDDHWRDIAGYATLSLKRCSAETLNPFRLVEETKPQEFTLYPGGELPKPGPREYWVLKPKTAPLSPPVYLLKSMDRAPTPDEV